MHVADHRTTNPQYKTTPTKFQPFSKSLVRSLSTSKSCQARPSTKSQSSCCTATHAHINALTFTGHNHKEFHFFLTLIQTCRGTFYILSLCGKCMSTPNTHKGRGGQWCPQYVNSQHSQRKGRSMVSTLCQPPTLTKEGEVNGVHSMSTPNTHKGRGGQWCPQYVNRQHSQRKGRSMVSTVCQPPTLTKEGEVNGVHSMSTPNTHKGRGGQWCPQYVNPQHSQRKRRSMVSTVCQPPTLTKEREVNGVHSMSTPNTHKARGGQWCPQYVNPKHSQRKRSMVSTKAASEKEERWERSHCWTPSQDSYPQNVIQQLSDW